MLHGVVPVIPTPFSNDGAHVLVDRFARVIDLSIREGARTIMLFGAAGEFYKLSEEEESILLHEALNVCRGRAEVAATVTRHSTLLAQRRANEYQEQGAALINIMPPSFALPGSGLIVQHILDVAQVVKVPLMIQHAPALTGSSIPNEAFAEIAERAGGELYVKMEAMPTGPAITSMIESTGGQYRIVIGNGGECLYEALLRGAVAVMPGAAVVKPYHDIISAFDSGDHREAQRLYNAFLPYLHFIHRSVEEFVCMEKMVLEARRVLSNHVCRKPYATLDTVSCKLLMQIWSQVEEVFYS